MSQSRKTSKIPVPSKNTVLVDWQGLASFAWCRVFGHLQRQQVRHQCVHLLLGQV